MFILYTKSQAGPKTSCALPLPRNPSSRASRETRHEREQLERVGDEKGESWRRVECSTTDRDTRYWLGFFARSQ